MTRFALHVSLLRHFNSSGFIHSLQFSFSKRFAATLTAEIAGRESCTKHTSINAKPISRYLQIDLVSGWLRAAIGRRFEADYDCEYFFFDFDSAVEERVSQTNS